MLVPLLRELVYPIAGASPDVHNACMEAEQKFYNGESQHHKPKSHSALVKTINIQWLTCPKSVILEDNGDLLTMNRPLACFHEGSWTRSLFMARQDHHDHVAIYQGEKD